MNLMVSHFTSFIGIEKIEINTFLNDVTSLKLPNPTSKLN